ncbi:MAG TPA: isoprenylcysteine carboxylmethyltransferase family protein [Terriglobales bacterium]|nr:isoprenylcysteine carboxylmethyltransferase family protein [Terriglobales bacterium]
MSPSAQKSFALVKTSIFTLLVPGTVALYVPYRFVVAEGRWFEMPRWPWQYLGILPFLVGVAIYLWCAWDFAVTGLGTPAPIDAPRVLVVKGLYRYMRNPMYAGVLNIILGWAVWFASRRVFIYFCCFWLAAHLFVLLYEEPTLKRKFPGQYADYCQRVNRWLPKMPATTAGNSSD